MTSRPSSSGPTSGIDHCSPGENPNGVPYTQPANREPSISTAIARNIIATRPSNSCADSRARAGAGMQRPDGSLVCQCVTGVAIGRQALSTQRSYAPPEEMQQQFDCMWLMPDFA